MVNTVDNNHNVRIMNKRKDPEADCDMKPKKVKSDEIIIESDKNTKTMIKMKNKCHKCNRKLTLVGIYECRCGNNYCNRHRFHDQHGCTFDYKTLALEKLKIENCKIRNRRIGN